MNLRIFLIIVFILNLVQGIFTPIIDDEAYYWLWSTKLDFGYFDHPPMVALWIALSDMLFNGEIGARFFTVFFNTITAFLFWKILEPKSKKEITLFTITYFSLVFVQIFSFVSTPDAPLLFFTVAYLYVLKNYITNQSALWTTLLGICFAGLMYSKYHGLLVLIFTLVPILTFVIKKPTFYIAIILSLILYSPHFYWLYLNDFPPILYHFIDRSAEQKFSFSQPLIYVITALIGAAGLLFFYIAPALKKVNTKDLFKKSVFWLVIGPFLFFLISTLKDTTQAQWLLISYVAIGLILYWYLIQLENLKWVKILGFSTVGLILIARIFIMIPSISPLYETKSFGYLSGNLAQTEIVAFEKYQEASIFQFYNRDNIGVVYRTLGNRNSQFTLWDSENLLNQSFTYISPWLQSSLSFEGIKKREYYITLIKNYKPIHQTKATFFQLNGDQILNQTVSVQKGITNKLLLEVSAFDIELLKNNEVELNIYITKGTNYNIVEQINVPFNSIIVNSDLKNIYQFEIDFTTQLDTGIYSAYIGVNPKNLIAKYQSKPLKIIVTE